MERVVRILGNVLLYAAIALILIGYASTVYFEGFGKLQELLSPFNVVNWLVTVITLAPGVLLLMWADKLKRRQEPRPTTASEKELE